VTQIFEEESMENPKGKGQKKEKRFSLTYL